MKRFFSCFSILLLFSISAFGSDIDDLTRRFHQAEGEEKLQIMNNATRTLYAHGDTLFFYLDLFHAEAVKQKSKEYECRAVMNKIQAYYDFGYLHELEIFAKEYIPVLKENGFHVFQYACEHFLIETLLRFNKEDEAFRRAQTIFEEAQMMNHPQFLALANRTLGYFYFSSNRKEDAYQHYREALKYALEAEKHVPLLINIYFQLIEFEIETGRCLEAIHSCNAVLLLYDEEKKRFEDNNISFDLSPYYFRVYCFLAGAFTGMEDFDQAKAYLEKAEKIMSEEWPPSMLFVFHEFSMKYHLRKENYGEALRYINNIIELSYEGDELGMLSYLKLKAGILLNMNEFETSALLYRDIQEKRDSITTVEFAKQLDDLRVRYQTAEKENQILKQNAQIRTMRFWMICVSISFLLLTAIVVIVLTYNRKINEKNKNLVHQIKALSEKTSEVNVLRKKIVESNVEQPYIPSLFERFEEVMQSEKMFLNPDVSREDVSKTVFTNSTYLSEAIKTATGLTFSDYVCKLRLEHAKDLLIDSKEKESSIADVAFSSGFNTVRTFNRLFKEKYGLTPTEMRKQ